MNLLVQRIEKSAALAEEILAGQISRERAKDELAILKIDFGFDRLALRNHLRDKRLALGAYDYLIAATYIGELSSRVAFAERALRAGIIEGQAGPGQPTVPTDEVKIVFSFVRKANRRLRDARKALKIVRRTQMTLRLAYASFRNRNREQVAAYDPIEVQRKRRAVTPLGFGDIEFMLNTAAAAVQQLARNYDTATFIFSTNEEKLIGDDAKALDACKAFITGLTENSTLPPYPGPLMVAGGLALATAESAVSRERLSQRAMRTKSNLYLVRAALCLGHFHAARSTQARRCVIIPPTAAHYLAAHRERAIILARSYLNTSRALADRAKSLKWHDRRWRFLGARLDPNFNGHDVLYMNDEASINKIARTIELHLTRAERYIAMRAPNDI